MCSSREPYSSCETTQGRAVEFGSEKFLVVPACFALIAQFEPEPNGLGTEIPRVWSRNSTTSTESAKGGRKGAQYDLLTFKRIYFN